MKKLWLLPLTALLVSATALAANASFVQEEDLGKVAFDIGHIQTEWIPDGIWTEGEYTRIARKTSWLSAYVNDDADMDTALNLAFDLGLSWDAEYVYAFVRFTDPDGHVCPMDADTTYLWAAGCMQICYADAGNTGHDQLEYALGASSKTGNLLFHRYADYLDAQFTPVDGTDAYCSVNTTEEGDVVTYEFRTPFTAFSTVAPQAGSTYGLCYVLSWGNSTIDEAGNLNWLVNQTQLASGCTGASGKAAQNFAKFTLVDSTAYDATVEIAADTENVRAGDVITYDILLSGTYDGFSFTIEPPQDMTITEVVGGEAIGERTIDVTVLSDGRCRVSIFPGCEQVDAPQKRIATVTLSVNEGIAVGTHGAFYPDSAVTQITDTHGNPVTGRLLGADYTVIAFVEGDVNTDGVMDYLDVTKLYSVYQSSAAVTNARIADVNGDGVFDYLDIAKLYVLVRRQ